ncbi:MAG: IclR family transcriptional regulator [Desulfovibrio sp.]
MSNLINSVERALDVLLYFNAKDAPVGVSQISKELGVHKSTVFRTLATLESRRFVAQDPESGKYSLGISLFALGRKITVYDVFKPFAKRLCDEFKESINISILEMSASGTYKSTIVVKEDSKDNVLSVSPKIGTSMDCYCSSVGKCLLAFSSNVSTSAFEGYSFIDYTDNTIGTVAELLAELEKVRKAGYAVDAEEQEVGLTCVGVPIFDRHGRAIAAMSVSGPTQRVRSRKLETVVARLRETAAEITEHI